VDPKEIFGKDYSSFSAEDPFNNNEVEGYICRQQSDKYGSLLINKVNGKKCPQLIYCTPKIDYPFDRNGNWRFPRAKRIERYEKLDGTNIFAYRYRDDEDSQYLTYKTRLLPFVGNSKFGPFLQMLKEIILKYPDIKNLPWKLNMNLSFELWGARNPHLVLYDKPLELSFLFARDGQKILPPLSFDVNISIASFKGLVDRDYISSYKQSQNDMNSNLKEVEGEKYQGQEGEVWYLLLETGDWIMFKCKPEIIESIHWGAGGIGRNIIRATCQNAFENWDNPTIENVVSLLLEEFNQQEIDKAYYNIQKYLNEETINKGFKQEVLSEYYKIGINLLENKAGVMRQLSTKFKREQMKKIYTIIWVEVSS